jgi:hypothetical protein
VPRRAFRAARSGKPPRAEIDAILARRDDLVAEIRRLQASGANSRFVLNAQHLLTLWWSRSDWTAREELLRTAGWLIGLVRAAPDAAHDVACARISFSSISRS